MSSAGVYHYLHDLGKLDIGYAVSGLHRIEMV